MTNTKLICCFIGHRTIEITEDFIFKLKLFIEDLILNKGYSIFLFGSRSDFDYLCHSIVTELKTKYPYIKRISYTCRSETCTLESEREKWEKIYSYFEKREVHLLGVEEEYEHKTKYMSGKASYVERNFAMIDDSHLCIFYYREDYKPEMRKYSKKSIGYYQPKSGTRLAYQYAIRKKKYIINFCNTS